MTALWLLGIPVATAGLAFIAYVIIEHVRWVRRQRRRAGFIVPNGRERLP